MANDLHTAIKHSTLTVIKAGRHLTPLEKPDEIAAYWAGGMRYDNSPEERRDFYKTFLRLVWNNFGLFLEGRAITFVGSAGLQDGSFLARRPSDQDELVRSSQV